MAVALRRPAALLALLLVALFSSGAADRCHALEALPFQVGEKITYQLKWGVIPAGRVVLEVLPLTSINGLPARHFRMTIRSNGFIDTVYKVRSSFDGFTDLRLNHSLRYRKKQREGSSRRHIVVHFDPEQQTSQYHNQKKRPRAPLAVPPGCFDPFSVIYFCRLFDPAAYEFLERPVSDGKKWKMGRVTNRGRETLLIDDKEYDTFLLEPDIKDLSGVFKKSRDANLFIWMSADRRRIPVKVQSKVIVGSFTAEMIRYEAP